MYLEQTELNDFNRQWFALQQLDAGHITMMLKVFNDARQRIGLLDQSDRVRLEQITRVIERDVATVCKPIPKTDGPNI
jgi:hypothetical protein